MWFALTSEYLAVSPYRFGRYIQLLLVHRESCPVVEALDRQLAAVEAGASSA